MTLSGSKLCSSEDRDDMNLLRSTLSCLRQASAALRLLENVVDRSAANVMTSLSSLSFERGLKIRNFPDDIVSLIFGYAHKSAVEDDDDYDIDDKTKSPPICRQSLLLSHICRDWRFLACSMPELWTTLSNLQHPDSISHFIRLSKGQPLHVAFIARASMFSILPNSFDAFLKRNDFLLEVLPLSTKWQSFSLYFSPEEAEDEVDLILPGIVRAFRNLKFDSLEELSVRLESWFDGLREGSTTNSLFSSWYIPKLRSCSVVDFIPSVPVSKHITSLNVDFVEDISEPVASESIFRFIRQHKNLTELTLLFSPTNHVMFFAEKGVTLRGGLDLPFLRKLRIRTPIARTYDLIKNFIRSLSRPTLEEVTLEFRICLHEPEDQSVDTYLSAYFERELNSCLQELSRHESLRSFKLVIAEKAKVNPYHSNNALDSVFSNLPHLQNLVISAPDFPAPTIKGLHSPLRTLSLNNCSGFDDQFIRDLFGALLARGAMESFERLSVDGCDNLRKEVILSFLPRSKVVWE